MYNYPSVNLAMDVAYVDRRTDGRGSGSRRWRERTMCANWLLLQVKGAAQSVAYGRRPSHNKAQRDCGI